MSRYKFKNGNNASKVCAYNRSECKIVYDIVCVNNTLVNDGHNKHVAFLEQ